MPAELRTTYMSHGQSHVVDAFGSVLLPAEDKIAFVAQLTRCGVHASTHPQRALILRVMGAASLPSLAGRKGFDRDIARIACCCTMLLSMALGLIEIVGNLCD
jgi:hypothetical protein